MTTRISIERPMIPAPSQNPDAAPTSAGGPRDGAARARVAYFPGRDDDSHFCHQFAGMLRDHGYDVTNSLSGHDVAAEVTEARAGGAVFVAVGSDTGALTALSSAGGAAARPDAVVLLGLPVLRRAVGGQALPVEPPRSLPDLPILAVHGQEDLVSPVSQLRMLARTATGTRLLEVRGGHDVLASQSRRLMWAQVVLFIEEIIEAAAIGG
jgi:hypothetical protein